VPPNVLLLINALGEAGAPGQIDAYRCLADTGEISSVTPVFLRTNDEPNHHLRQVVEILKSRKHDVVVVLSPSGFPPSERRFAAIEQAIGDRPLLYWEGDAWGKGKPVDAIMQRWLGRADIVFSVAGEPQVSALLDAGARRVHLVLHTYCHVRWRTQELSPPPIDTEIDAVMIASNSARIPLLAGLPGSTRRLELALRLRTQRHLRSAVFGHNWPPGLSDGFLPFDQQVQAIRRAKASVNWDQYPRHADYASNRLPISLLAGRPHVTTRHPGMAWAPGPDVGLYQESSPRAIVRRLAELTQMDPVKRHQLGCEAHRWVAHRLSSREAARHMLSTVVSSVKPPPADPWALLPGPWIGQ